MKLNYGKNQWVDLTDTCPPEARAILDTCFTAHLARHTFRTLCSNAASILLSTAAVCLFGILPWKCFPIVALLLLGNCICNYSKMLRAQEISRERITECNGLPFR